MSLAVQIDQNGGPEVMKLVDVTVGEPGPGEIRIRHKAIGLNFIDVYQRAGLYPLPMPLKLGMEASGVVEAVGDRVAVLVKAPSSLKRSQLFPAAGVKPLMRVTLTVPETEIAPLAPMTS